MPTPQQSTSSSPSSHTGIGLLLLTTLISCTGVGWYILCIPQLQTKLLLYAIIPSGIVCVWGLILNDRKILLTALGPIPLLLFFLFFQWVR